MDKYSDVPASFVGHSGKFYIRQRRADGKGYAQRLTVWPSVEDYNQRKAVLLEFCDIADISSDFSHELQICPQTLTTTWPTDRDESDVGLTPQRNIWLNRFQKVREGRSNAT